MKAILFDLNGTMIDDMEFHMVAWYRIMVEEMGVDFTREQLRHEMYGKNSEVLERVFGKGRFTQEEMDEISVRKEKAYQASFKPHLKLIDGLDAFIEKAHARSVKMAVASAAITDNIDFVLDGLDIRKYISAIVSADDVKLSKPDPETFTMAAERLGLKAEDCLVFEDNPNGVMAARNGGMKALVITSAHEESDFEGMDNIIGFIKDYNDPFMEEVLEMFQGE